MKKRFLILTCSAIWSIAGNAASGQANGPAWDWTTALPQSQGMSGKKLESMTRALAARSTSGFLVIRNDKIVCEWYAPGLCATNLHFTASMAKAIVGGLSVAVALTDHRIALDDKAAKFIPQWQDDARKRRITIRQLGSHTSGLADAEVQDLSHDQLSGWEGEFWKQLAPPQDPFTIARDRTPMLFEPGSQIQYSNPGMAMLAYALTAVLKDTPYKDIRALLRERVMRPIGSADGEWSVGYGKTFKVDGLPLVATWGGGDFKARDVARIGRLMLRQGDWEGKQLLTPDAVRLVTSDVGMLGNCGIGWWNNNKGEYAGMPKDAFWGSGAGHQVLLIVPSLKLIAVRNGDSLGVVRESSDYEHPLYNLFFKPLMDAVTDQKPRAALQKSK